MFTCIVAPNEVSLSDKRDKLISTIDDMTHKLLINGEVVVSVAVNILQTNNASDKEKIIDSQNHLIKSSNKVVFLKVPDCEDDNSLAHRLNCLNDLLEGDLDKVEYQELYQEHSTKLSSRESSNTVIRITEHLRELVKLRGWKQFHDAKNLATSLSVEASELLELFIWLKSGDENLGEKWLKDITDESGDVMICLLMFCDYMGIDIVEATWQKIRAVEKKFPVEKLGFSDYKYSHYVEKTS